jgi:hypothetical protein
MVKYVGAQKRKEILRNFWVPKFYVTNPLGPKYFWVPKIKILICLCRNTPPV